MGQARQLRRACRRPREPGVARTVCGKPSMGCVLILYFSCVSHLLRRPAAHYVRVHACVYVANLKFCVANSKLNLDMDMKPEVGHDRDEARDGRRVRQ